MSARLWLAVRIPQPLTVIFHSLYKGAVDLRFKGFKVRFVSVPGCRKPLLTQKYVHGSVASKIDVGNVVYSGGQIVTSKVFAVSV